MTDFKENKIMEIKAVHRLQSLDCFSKTSLHAVVIVKMKRLILRDEIQLIFRIRIKRKINLKYKRVVEEDVFRGRQKMWVNQNLKIKNTREIKSLLMPCNKERRKGNRDK